VKSLVDFHKPVIATGFFIIKRILTLCFSYDTVTTEKIILCMNGHGALSNTDIELLLRNKFIKNLDPGNIKPSSFDITLSEECYEIRAPFQTPPGKTVRSCLKKIGAKPHSFTKPFLKSKTYLIKINEVIDFPRNVYGMANPKSSTGRLGIHARLQADFVPKFDCLWPAGWSGEVWVLVTLKVFNMKLYPGTSLNQLRLFNEDTRLKSDELEVLMQESGLLYKEIKKGQKKHINFKEMNPHNEVSSVVLTIDLKNASPFGYVAKDVEEVIDISKVNYYEKDAFWEPLYSKEEMFLLKRDKFYIMCSYEHMVVPPDYAVEIVSMDDRFGEFRSHFAGFVDPGWGYGKHGEVQGRPIVFEIISSEDMFVRDHQPFARSTYEKMANTPTMIYDMIQSNYTVQDGPRLAKQFKM
jgi:dCTP deaminase